MLRTLLAVCAVCFGSLPSQSEEYWFKVRSLHPNAVHMKFYSQTRKGHEWPTSKTAWNLPDDEVHALGMTCNKNEKICWGAWVKNTGLQNGVQELAARMTARVAALVARTQRVQGS
jgi:hypothetical protein